VSGAELQNEGVARVLDNLAGRAGATAVACNPHVAAPAPDGVGRFQPPPDAGASVRLLERPLWGRSSLWVQSAPAFAPRTEFYAQSSYRPQPATPLTAEAGAVIGAFVRAARSAGLRVSTQFPAATPPGLQPTDEPLLPDGRRPERMAATGSLAAPDIRAWNHAALRDVLTEYPEFDEIRLDWPETPCYKLDEVFQDFGPTAIAWAADRGYPVEAIRRDVAGLYHHLHGGLTNAEIEAVAAAADTEVLTCGPFARFPLLAQWLEWKAALVVDLLADWRDALTNVAGAAAILSANAFAPPYHRLTGFDYGAAAQPCSIVAPKLYAMHWSMMIDFWCRPLLAANAGLDEQLLVTTMARLLGLVEPENLVGLADFGYPAPDQPQPVTDGQIRRKIEHVRAAVAGGAAVFPVVHGYGPLADFERRLRAVADSDADGVWINRYGYLSDEKLDAIKRIWDEPPPESNTDNGSEVAR
jgi:hypothetical protein